MFRYRLHWADGSDAGEAEYALNIRPGDIVWLRGGEQARVLDLVPLQPSDSPFVGLLRLEEVAPQGGGCVPTGNPPRVG
jgi:hypothetical protein